MKKEIHSELSLLKMNLATRTLSLDQLHHLLAVATTSIPEEVRAKYIRAEGISTVQADVHVEAQGEKKALLLQADVRVKLTYQGDMVRSAPWTRQKIGNRLQELAQKYCAQEACKILIKTSSNCTSWSVDTEKMNQ